MIDRVRNQQSANAIEYDAVWLFELHKLSRLSFPRKTWLTVSGNRGDNTGFRIDPPNHMISRVSDVQVACLIGSDFVRPIECCVDSGTTVHRSASRAAAAPLPALVMAWR